MDETVEKPIASYSEAKSAVKQSFLGRMVGPAFAASLLAAATTVMPFPAGAYDYMPDVWADTTYANYASAPPIGFPYQGAFVATFLLAAIPAQKLFKK